MSFKGPYISPCDVGGVGIWVCFIFLWEDGSGYMNYRHEPRYFMTIYCVLFGSKVFDWKLGTHGNHWRRRNRNFSWMSILKNYVALFRGTSLFGCFLVPCMIVAAGVEATKVSVSLIEERLSDVGQGQVSILVMPLRTSCLE